MPYKDPIKKGIHDRAYKKSQYERRRKAFFEGKACVDCGAKDNLQLSHKSARTTHNHRMFSLSKERIVEELKKFTIRCKECNIKRSIVLNKSKPLLRIDGHGLTKYRKGCRCWICQKAKEMANKRHRNSRSTL